MYGSTADAAGHERRRVLACRPGMRAFEGQRLHRAGSRPAWQPRPLTLRRRPGSRWTAAASPSTCASRACLRRTAATGARRRWRRAASTSARTARATLAAVATLPYPTPRRAMPEVFNGRWISTHNTPHYPCYTEHPRSRVEGRSLRRTRRLGKLHVKSKASRSKTGTVHAVVWGCRACAAAGRGHGGAAGAPPAAAAQVAQGAARRAAGHGRARRQRPPAQLRGAYRGAAGHQGAVPVTLYRVRVVLPCWCRASGRRSGCTHPGGRPSTP